MKTEELIDLCVDIYAHSDLDYEITLCGNGTNAFEAAFVANAILRILGTDRDALEGRIQKRIEEIE